MIINKSISLIGINTPILDGRGNKTIITIQEATDVVVRGFKIINSGRSYSTEDSGIKIIKSSNVYIQENEFYNVFYAILPKDSYNIWITDNIITSIPDYYVADRGHGIYSWYTRYLYIINNEFRDVQDASYNDHVYNAYIINNVVEEARYGVHLMYCENITIEKSYITDSIAGLVLMYSKGIRASDNTILLLRKGGIGEAVFIPECDDIWIENNSIIGNIVGINLRKTPFTPGKKAVIKGNTIAFNYIGIRIDSESAAEIYENNIIENIMDVSLIGVDIGDTIWFNMEKARGNFWSEYHYRDMDGDGVGDVPYISQDILEDLMDGYRQLRIFLYSPGYLVLENMKKVILINPRKKAIDLYPLIHPTQMLGGRIIINPVGVMTSFILTIIPLSLIMYLRRRWVR